VTHVPLTSAQADGTLAAPPSRIAEVARLASVTDGSSNGFTPRRTPASATAYSQRTNSAPMSNTSVTVSSKTGWCADIRRDQPARAASSPKRSTTNARSLP